MKTKVAVLGSTGSIGTQTLQVLSHFADRFEVAALAARVPSQAFEAQCAKYRPKEKVLFEEEGIPGLVRIAEAPDIPLIVVAISGSIALPPTLAAIRAGKRIAFASKEVLVMGGALVMEALAAATATLIPIDSEHSSLFQLLQCHPEIVHCILTASGGPFLTWTEEAKQNITVADALRHPTWKMGKKVTVDSSTLMNKGLEVIEAHYLFNLRIDQIQVVIHPQSLVHALITLQDGSHVSHWAQPDMLLPIQYALLYPERLLSLAPPIDWTHPLHLDFIPPRPHQFPCLDLAYAALETGGSMPCYLNGANEALVDLFLKQKISWTKIASTLSRLMERHQTISHPDLETTLGIDQMARRDVQEAIGC